MNRVNYRKTSKVGQGFVYKVPSLGGYHSQRFEFSDPERQISSLLEGVWAGAVPGSVSDFPVVATNDLFDYDRINQAGVGLKSVLGSNGLRNRYKPAFRQRVQTS